MQVGVQSSWAPNTSGTHGRGALEQAHWSHTPWWLTSEPREWDCCTRKWNGQPVSPGGAVTEDTRLVPRATHHTQYPPGQRTCQHSKYKQETFIYKRTGAIGMEGRGKGGQRNHVHPGQLGGSAVARVQAMGGGMWLVLQAWFSRPRSQAGAGARRAETTRSLPRGEAQVRHWEPGPTMGQPQEQGKGTTPTPPSTALIMPATATQPPGGVGEPAPCDNMGLGKIDCTEREGCV